MRRIQTAEEIERKRKKRGMLLAIMMGIILLGSIAGYGFFYNTDNQNTGTNNQLGRNELNFRGQTLYLTNTKESVQSIPVDITSNIDTFAGSPLYIASESTGISGEI